MRYTRISADCHVDLCWLPPDLFTSNASAAMKDRMPYVTDGPKGPVWVTKKGANLGLMNGMGSAGREYVPGKIQRSDRMACDRSLRGRQARHPEAHRPGAALEGPGARRRAGRGALWDPRRHPAAE